MVKIAKIPKEVKKAFGEDGTDKFIDFLNETLVSEKEDVIETVNSQFELKLKQEIELLRKEQQIEFKNIQNQFSEVHRQFSEVHKTISNQTKWILAAILGAAIVYPIIVKLIDKLIP